MSGVIHGLSQVYVLTERIGRQKLIAVKIILWDTSIYNFVFLPPKTKIMHPRKKEERSRGPQVSKYVGKIDRFFKDNHGNRFEDFLNIFGVSPFPPFAMLICASNHSKFLYNGKHLSGVRGIKKSTHIIFMIVYKSK